MHPHSQVSLHCYAILGPTWLWEKRAGIISLRADACWVMAHLLPYLSLSLSLSLYMYVCVCVSTIVSAQTTMRINFKMSQGHWRHISQVTSCRFFRGFSHVSKQSRLFLTKSTFNHNWQTTEDQVSVTVKIQISILENIHYLKIFWTIKINLIPKMSSSKHFS